MEVKTTFSPGDVGRELTGFEAEVRSERERRGSGTNSLEY